MTRREELEALAARVESLTGACRETDARIWCALNGKKYRGNFAPYGQWEERYVQVQYSEPPKRTYLVTGDRRGGGHALRVTNSLDAAMALVPEGWRWCDYHWPRKDEPKIMTLVTNIPHSGVAHGRSSTPALALTAAALRALAQE